MEQVIAVAAVLVFPALWRLRVSAALVALALAGFAVQEGLVALPGAVSGPIAEQRMQLERWQERRADGLSCQLAAHRALAGESDPEVASAMRACARAR